jgi:hypothetical protein
MKLAESKKTIYDQDLLSLVPQTAVSNWQLAFSFLAVWLIRWLVPSLGLHRTADWLVANC